MNSTISMSIPRAEFTTAVAYSQSRTVIEVNTYPHLTDGSLNKIRVTNAELSELP
jgi:hypothetical protein